MREEAVIVLGAIGIILIQNVALASEEKFFQIYPAQEGYSEQVVLESDVIECIFIARSAVLQKEGKKFDRVSVSEKTGKLFIEFSSVSPTIAGGGTLVVLSRKSKVVESVGPSL